MQWYRNHVKSRPGWEAIRAAYRQEKKGQPETEPKDKDDNICHISADEDQSVKIEDDNITRMKDRKRKHDEMCPDCPYKQENLKLRKQLQKLRMHLKSLLQSDSEESDEESQPIPQKNRGVVTGHAKEVPKAIVSSPILDVSSDLGSPPCTPIKPLSVSLFGKQIQNL